MNTDKVVQQMVDAAQERIDANVQRLLAGLEDNKGTINGQSYIDLREAQSLANGWRDEYILLARQLYMSRLVAVELLEEERSKLNKLGETTGPRDFTKIAEELSQLVLKQIMKEVRR